MSTLRSLLEPDLIFLGLDVRSRDEALHSIAQSLTRLRPALGSPVVLFEELRRREEIEPTAIGDGVAVPHCKLGGIEEPIVAFAAVPRGVSFGTGDAAAIHLLFVVISPRSGRAAATSHLDTLARIARWVRSCADLESVSASENVAGVLAAFGDIEEGASAPSPVPGAPT